MSEAPRRSPNSANPVTAPRAVPCHRNCSSAHATACAAGCRKNAPDVSIALVSSVVTMCATAGLPFAFYAVNDFPDFPQLVGGRALRRERLHHQLPGRPAERAIEQIPD